MIYALISGSVPPLCPPLFCDVCDVAEAHIAALVVPPQVPVNNKHFLVSGGFMLWKEVTEYLVDTRAELRGRLPNLDKFGMFPGHLSTIDGSRAKGALGLDIYIGWKDTVRDTINSLLIAEKTWNMKTDERLRSRI
jgi:nucleoside-diphosphate-sugar epimerase